MARRQRGGEGQQQDGGADHAFFSFAATNRPARATVPASAVAAGMA
jgi:hypothetical protein